MPLQITSSEAQQDFGSLLDRVLSEDDVVVERHGSPRVAVVEYERYLRLVEAERTNLRERLWNASVVATARAAYQTEDDVDRLIEQARRASSMVSVGGQAG